MNDVEFAAAEARDVQEAQLWALLNPQEHREYLAECDRRIEAWVRENSPPVGRPTRTRESRRAAAITEAAPMTDQQLSEALVEHVFGSRTPQPIVEHTAPVEAPVDMPELPEIVGPMNDDQLAVYTAALPGLVLSGPLSRAAGARPSSSPFWGGFEV